MDSDNESSEGGMWQRLKESPRTVSALIIILIVAAAIYAFSGEENSQPNIPVSDEVAVTEGGDEGDEVIKKEPQVAAGVSETEQTPEALPEVQRTNEGYEEVAQAGEGQWQVINPVHCQQ